MPGTDQDTSAKPSLTASKVPPGGTTGCGSILYLIRPLDAFSRSAPYSFSTCVMKWVGSQLENVSVVVWACAGSAALARPTMIPMTDTVCLTRMAPSPVDPLTRSFDLD